MLRRAVCIAFASLLIALASPVRSQEAEPSADPTDREAGGELSAGDGYALDAVARRVPERGRLRCDISSLVTYRGSTLRFSAPARVHSAFVPYLRRFEAIASEVAAAVYGRRPRVLAHAGVYSCRRIRRSPATLSEHALGNAIDLRGFDFAAAAHGASLPLDLPARFAHSFRVRVLDHWAGNDPRDAVHARFFARLRERLEAEPDLFTVMLGPSYPGHRNHVHLDRAPFRFTQF